ncbi:receptor-type tyrosine-protein phosphatase T-like [Diadema setosum]|uniref:receptor-type tyrosine-protein phosphatase T-like n=1 Tax=Diadema setosum TaxID=31175 RepID=UPI003B3BBC91
MTDDLTLDDLTEKRKWSKAVQDLYRNNVDLRFFAGISSLTSVKVNPNQPSSLTCVVEGDPPPNATDISLYRLIDGVRNDSGIRRSQSFLDSSGEKLLPVLEAAPTVTTSTSSSLTIEWMAWNEQTDIGDPPVTEYITYYRIPGGNWNDGQIVAASMTSATVDGLDPDTDYEVSVAAVREGPGGTGPRSNVFQTTTKCASPSASPILVSATVNAPRQINITWQAPPNGTGECRSGFIAYTVHYTAEISDFSGSKLPETFPSTEVILTDLEPYLEYTISVTAANKDSESDPSNDMIVRTLEETPPSPVNVAISDTSQDSLTVTWSAATPKHLNGAIQAYRLQYRRTAPEIDSNYTVITVDDGEFDVIYPILDLLAGSMYSVQIRTVNGVGESDWSPMIVGETNNPPSAIGAIAGGVVGGLTIFTIVGLVVGFIFYRRRSDENQDKEDLDGRNDSADEQSRVVYVNAVSNEPDEHLYEGVEAIAVIERTAVISDSKHKALPNPKHYPNHQKDQKDGGGDRETGASKELDSLSGSKEWSGSHDNLNEQEMEESNKGVVYQDVAAPSCIPIHELQAYIKNKKAEKGNGLIKEYHMLKSSQLHPWYVASKEQNKSKNRLKNIIAYDHSRVVLQTTDGDPHSDYYNANYVNNYRGEKVFIASQAPNKASLTDFWRMIWQENVETIVMVTNLTEDGKDQCEQYWPMESLSINIGRFSIFSYKEQTYSDRTIRELVVKQVRYALLDGEKRAVTQFHYLSWPDMGVPEYYTTLLDFVEAVLHHHATMSPTDRARPMLVHCSAGAGRTGTFLTLYNMLCMMQETGKVDIFGYVNQMRENRIEMIQTQDQYVFIYNALLEIYMSGQTNNIPVSQFKKKLETLNRMDPKTKKTNIQLEYELLDILAPVPPSNAFKGGKMPQNKNKNRFQDILPLETKRPCLVSEGLEDSTDYINASFMNTFTHKDVFVATQAPLPNTVVDMWRLVFDLKCPVIVMLNELDPTDEACAQYWPNEGTLQLGSLNVERVGSSSAPFFDSDTFTVSSKGESVSVTQFRLYGWSAASNKLRSPISLIHLVKAVQKEVKTAHTSGPVIVHCINGVGRSGVFCALWSVIDKCQRDSAVDIFHAVQVLRTNRPNMVESLDQYKLCYDAMSRYLQQEKAYMVYMNVGTS